MQRWLMIVTLLLLAGTAARAEDITSADYWLPRCKQMMDNVPAGWEQGMCMGMVLGLSSHNAQCRPPDVTVAQLLRVVVIYIEAHPARMQENFGSLAMEAMKAAWPCN